MDSDASGDAVELEFQDDSTPGDSGAPFWATWSDGFPMLLVLSVEEKLHLKRITISQLGERRWTA
jgi:hypothetical protein